MSHGVPRPSSVHAGTPGVSLFKQAHFGRVKGRYLTRHGPTIKAPFESSTFINLKQSLDLKAESSKLPERIIKQPVSSSVHFSAICTRHFTVSGGRPISPQQAPAPVLSGFHAFRAHKGEAMTGESRWGHGSLPHAGSRRERAYEFQTRRATACSSAAGGGRTARRRGHPWLARLLRPGSAVWLPHRGVRGLEGCAQDGKEQISNLPSVHPPSPTALLR